jgi:hypothetical protein
LPTLSLRKTVHTVVIAILKSVLPYLTILFVSTVIWVTPSHAQYTVAASGAYTTGFNSQRVEIVHSSVSQKWHQGYQFNLINGYRWIDKSVEITSRVGMKYLASLGEFQNIPYHTETYKLLVGLGTLFHFDSKITLGTLIMLENNLDFEDFIAQTSDLFRYSFQGEIYYLIRKKLALFLHVSVALTPLSDHYLVTNPQHQISLGIKYTIL